MNFHMCVCVCVCIGLNDIWVGKAFKHLWLCLLKHLNTVWVMVDQVFPYTYRLLHNLDMAEKKLILCSYSLYSDYLLQARVAYILITSIFLHLESWHYTVLLIVISNLSFDRVVTVQTLPAFPYFNWNVWK